MTYEIQYQHVGDSNGVHNLCYSNGHSTLAEAVKVLMDIHRSQGTDLMDATRGDGLFILERAVDERGICYKSRKILVDMWDWEEDESYFDGLDLCEQRNYLGNQWSEWAQQFSTDREVL